MVIDSGDWAVLGSILTAIAGGLAFVVKLLHSGVVNTTTFFKPMIAEYFDGQKSYIETVKATQQATAKSVEAIDAKLVTHDGLLHDIHEATCPDKTGRRESRL